MKKAPIAVAMCLVLAISLLLAPFAAAAGRFQGAAGFHTAGGFHRAGGFHHAGGRGFVGRPIVSHPFVHRPFVARPFFPRPFFRPFVPFGVGAVVVAPPLYAYGAPPAYYSTPYYDSSSYYAPPASYAPSVAYAPPAAYAAPAGGSVSVAPSPAPMQTVVEFSTGRYELRGDGTTVPYTWVWIPNPPSAPPGAPPAAPPTPGDPVKPRRQSQIYRWIDGDGTVHLTDSLDAVPKPHRAQAKQAPPS